MTLESITRKLLPTAVGITSLLLTQGVAAQSGDRNTRGLEEVVVTAERREASIQDTSISITAFTGEFIDDFGIRNQEDLQNFVPATTIQPYDATVRGVGRNFRALGGDPGVSTYMNGIYSEDLLTATAATFWDVERIEVLRGPQGTLYGRNAVGGAMNILYKEPTEEFEGAVKGIIGDFGTNELYGMASGTLIEDQLMGRINIARRNRDGSIREIGDGPDIDSLGTRNIAVLLKWTPTENLTFNLRNNRMHIDRVMGGANGGGVVSLNEEGNPYRNTTSLSPGYRFVDTGNTDPANFLDNDFYDTNSPLLQFTHPTTGAVSNAQSMRAGIDPAPTSGDGSGPQWNGFLNAAASLDGFGITSPESAARLNACVFPNSSIDGKDLCAATNGVNEEVFIQEGLQFNAAWDITENLQLKYLFGFNDLSYRRYTDDDNTNSQFWDRTFYVNHEAIYRSHELQLFWDPSERFSVTSGIFFYDAQIDQRGDFYPEAGGDRYKQPYVDNTALSAAGAAAAGSAALEGLPASILAFQGRPPADLYTAKDLCETDNSCGVNSGDNNLYTSAWYGDDGTNPRLNAIHGPRTVGSDLLYHTQTVREAFAFYTQGVYEISDRFALTVGIRYAEDKLQAEENVWRYSETGGESFLALYGGLAVVNQINGGLVDDGNGNLSPTPLVSTGGIPFALSVHRPFERTDDKITYRVNLDYDINDNILMYFSVTTGFRAGGYNLVFFSNTFTYDPEELTAYEVGYKTRWLDNTLQLNGSFYYYDYSNIHTVGTELSAIGGTTTSVLEAPGARISGAEAELTWLATDRLTLGGNFSYTPSEYTADLFLSDPARAEVPISLYPEFNDITSNIKGNQVLQVPDLKFTAYGTYRIPMPGGSALALSATYAYTDEVFYSPFEREQDKAPAFDRVDLRATWTSREERMIVSAYINNVFDEIGILQVLRTDETEFFRQSAGTTVPRMMGLEFTYNLR